MVAKKTPVANKSTHVKKGGAFKKIRIGVTVGKDWDPVKKGSQPPTFPEHLELTKDDWGRYSVDAVAAVKMRDYHPDLLEIDIIPTKELSLKRLQKNHVNLTFWPEPCGAMQISNRLANEYLKAFKSPDSRLDPCWDYYDWIINKGKYMESCMKAGIPTIPTVLYKNGFDANQCMKDVQKQGWDKFFVKVGHYAMFGFGAINGKTEDFLGKRADELKQYAKETKKSKVFLLQPYTIKPNGEVFDEVRNFFINGEWRYSVFTHGTDESDGGYYEEPVGPRKEASRALAERIHQEVVLKAATWQGKRLTPLLVRIDIGVLPRKGGDSMHKTDNTYFMNEIEMTMCAWLDRYAPISVADVVAQASISHCLELLAGMLNAKRHVPDAANVKKVIDILNKRLGPFKRLKLNK